MTCQGEAQRRLVGAGEVTPPLKSPTSVPRRTLRHIVSGPTLFTLSQYLGTAVCGVKFNVCNHFELAKTF